MENVRFTCRGDPYRKRRCCGRSRCPTTRAYAAAAIRPGWQAATVLAYPAEKDVPAPRFDHRELWRVPLASTPVGGRLPFLYHLAPASGPPPMRVAENRVSVQYGAATLPFSHNPLPEELRTQPLVIRCSPDEGSR